MVGKVVWKLEIKGGTELATLSDVRRLTLKQRPISKSRQAWQRGTAPDGGRRDPSGIEGATRQVGLALFLEVRPALRNRFCANVVTSILNACSHCDLKVGKVVIVTQWKAAGLAAILGLAFMGNVARADPCKNLLGDFKRLINNANREISSALANLQDATRRSPDDKQRVALVAQNCAASAEALGTFKSYRVVLAACMEERDASRRDELDEVDRSISQIRASLDKACH